jgi:hypothetical protein
MGRERGRERVRKCHGVVKFLQEEKRSHKSAATGVFGAIQTCQQTLLHHVIDHVTVV